ncbi:protoporphyrinogen/coproporphyrinogen oxidase [Luethyella okanaganae]|uniref:Protoporphyrinogen/coproporphyrinogen oxidase n=1 Tax=Luethyella okanaganae TaxID=69372 RepID=A0ABW1VF49_9MICO
MTGDQPDEGVLSEGDGDVADVVVVGAGVAGLVAARECLRVGLRVTILEARDLPGGCVGSHELAGLRLDSGAESFATRGGSVERLLDELGLGGQIVAPEAGRAWLRLPGSGGAAVTVPLPKTALLGIPSSPLADDVRAAIGWGGALRAYLDRLMPVLTIGRETNLGAVVRKRMGRRVLDRLVSPISSGVYSANADELELDGVAPGLNQAMTRAGSLSGGVALLRADAPAGSAVRGIRGGMSRLVDALVADISRLDGELRTGARAARLDAIDDARAAGEVGDEKRWAVHVEDSVGERNKIRARAVIVAAPAAPSIALLSSVCPDWGEPLAGEWPAGPSVELATIVVDETALDDAPRGSGALIAAGTPGVTAKALTHATAKWAWLAETAGPGRHVIRLSYGRAGEAEATAALDDDAFLVLALHDASEILGVPLSAANVVAHARTVWRDALSHAAVGQRARVDGLRAALSEEPTLEAVGAWVAGTGLASVVPDARDAARRIRQHLLHL